MRFNIFLSIVAVAALSSCSAIYEDLEPCPKGADISLSFSNNMEGVDTYSKHVHCAKLLLYDADGNFYADYDAEDGQKLVDLPAGKYQILAYGGMGCQDASYGFGQEIPEPHHISRMHTFLKATRAVGESSDKLHGQYHGLGEFEVKEDDLERVPVTVDLTRNTNTFRILLSYVDGSPIKASDFKFYITADNAVSDHENNIVRQGDDVVYRSYKDGETATGMILNGQPEYMAWAEISIGRLTENSNATLHIDQANDGQESVVDLPLVQYLRWIREYDLSDANLDTYIDMGTYLDLQDSWTLTFMLDPNTKKIAGLTIKINKWEVILNQMDL